MSNTLEALLESHDNRSMHWVGRSQAECGCGWQGPVSDRGDVNVDAEHAAHVAHIIRERWHLTVIKTGRRGCRCAHCDDEPIMHVCSVCRNKRCPKASWHGYQCNNSNDTNQVARLEPRGEVQ